jgi:hypothetical protein
MISARDHLAELDALAYMERFRRPFDGSEEAWLAEAWREAMEDACLSDGEAADLLPVYRRELRRETGRLAEAADAS